MDAQTVMGVIGAGLAVVSAIAGVSMYSGKTRNVANGAMHKARNVETALQAHRESTDRLYVRKDVLGPQLRALQETVDRMDARQEKFFDRMIGPGA